MLLLILLTIINPKITESLVKLPFATDNQILTTAQAIRGTVNTLFSSLKLPKLKEKSRLEGYIILHKYFISITLQDYNSLNKIASLTRVSNKNGNNNIIFIDTINELIDESEKNENFNKDNVVVLYIEYFLNKLNSFKEQYSNVKVHINADVLKHLRNLKTLTSTKPNATNIREVDDDDEVLGGGEFWEPSGRRVYKGKRTRIKYYPFMASIHMFDTFHCAGSIISSDLVLTASSCLQLAYNNRLFRENPAFLSVRIGSSFYNGGGESIAVLEVYFYPSYNPKTLKHNICVLRLTRHIRFGKSRKVRKIKLDQHASPLPVNTNGITIVGWGAKEQGGILSNPWKNILSYAVLDIYPFHDCRDMYGKEYVSRENFCAGFISRGGGACNRDVGGPGIVSRKLAGIVSFGSPVCGSPDSPTVFTKVGYYLDWIENIMEQDVVTARKRTTVKPQTFYLLPMSARSSTTFKIPPMTGTLEPISIFDAENQHILRQFDDKLFKEFLNTMFTTEELEDYEELLRTLEVNRAHKQAPEQNETSNIAFRNATKIPKMDKIVSITAPVVDFGNIKWTQINLEEDTTSLPETFEDNITLIPETIEYDKDFDLSDLIKDEDLKKIIEEEIWGANLTAEEAIANLQEDGDFSIFGLTDVETNNENKLEYPDNSDKKELNILDNQFEDFTRSANRTDDELSEDMIYKILFEVMAEQGQNKSLV